MFYCQLGIASDNSILIELKGEKNGAKDDLILPCSFSYVQLFL